MKGLENFGVCGASEPDRDGDGTPDELDGCPDDPDKIDAGVCGCGEADTDTDADGAPDCEDSCPDDPEKTDPAICGCGEADTDTDTDGTPDCVDSCPDDAGKIEPAVCGCGVPEIGTDGDGAPDCIDPPNYAPVLEPIGNQTGWEGELLEFTIDATDPNPGDILTFGANNLPPCATFDPETRTFSWVPGFDQAGNYLDVEFFVSDSGDPLGIDAQLITITIGDVNRPPEFTPVGPLEVLEGDPLVFYVDALDPDGDLVAYSAATRPVGATFDADSGYFSWVPDYTQAGNYTLTFFATDSGSPSETGTLEVVVTVGENLTAIELLQALIAEVLALDLPKPIENSYLANLKKAQVFIEADRVNAAINQIDAFIHKVEEDIDKGKIGAADGNRLVSMAEAVIAELTGG